VPYHFIFVFPTDLQNTKDIEVEIPHIYKIQIVNNELIVEALHQNNGYTFLFVECDETKLNLLRLESSWKGKFDLKELRSNGESTYAPGYAFIQQCCF